jgi:hypothetical protein
MMVVTTWLASILIATLAVIVILIALPNSASEELDRASVAQTMLTNVGASAPSKHGMPHPVRR